MLNLFESQCFMQRIHCVGNDWTLATLYMIPNIGTFLVYSIGFSTLWSILRKKAAYAKLAFLPFMLTLMSVFFFFCGGTHLLDALAMWWPAYRFFALWEWIQFAVALMAFIYAAKIIRLYVR